jgi:hypothetical protein
MLELHGSNSATLEDGQESGKTFEQQKTDRGHRCHEFGIRRSRGHIAQNEKNMTGPIEHVKKVPVQVGRVHVAKNVQHLLQKTDLGPRVSYSWCQKDSTNPKEWI